MKVLVIGDSHGNIANLKHVMGFAKEINAGAVIHTGDWNDLKSIETVLEYKIPLYTVLGNADIDPIALQNLKNRSKKFDNEYLRIEIDGIKIGIVHNSIKYNKLFDNIDIVFTGHFHAQKDWETTDYIQNKRIKMIRPGNLETNISFAIFDTITKVVEFIHE